MVLEKFLVELCHFGGANNVNREIEILDFQFHPKQRSDERAEQTDVQ